MKTFPSSLLRPALAGLLGWLALGVTLLPAQDAPPTATPPTQEPALRDSAPPAPPAPPPADVVIESEGPSVEAASPKASELKPVRRGRTDPTPRYRDIIIQGGDAILPAGERAGDVVAIFGNTHVSGDAVSDTVAVMGDVVVDGTVGSDAVAVLGSVEIEGEVKGDVVAVLGGVRLGPKAIVRGEVVSIGGSITREPGAQILGGEQQITFLFGSSKYGQSLRAWFSHAFRWGRPLAFGEHLEWVVLTAGAFLVLYLAITLLFGRAVTRCAETLEERPGLTILASLLTLLATPILLGLLTITIVGPFALLFALFIATFVGKAAVLNWLGRRVTVPLGLGVPVLATLIGGLIVAALYFVPFLGFVLWAALTTLGIGMVVHTLIIGMQRDRAARLAAKPPVVRPVVVTGNAFTPPPVPTEGASVAPGTTAATASEAASVSAGFSAGGPVVNDPYVAPPPFTAPPPLEPARIFISALTLPRADFGVRLGAMLVDLLLVGAVTGMMQIGGVLPVWLVVYAAVMWKLKGTTIGGIIFNLKVVRLDDREVDWSTAIVRSLGCLISMIPAGLGFIWAAFDDEKQSWHDKIAGTTVVRVPKSISLV